MSPQPHLWLVGPSGVGKSRVAPPLARTLGLACVDSDLEIERAARMTVSELFEREGEDGFRAREAAALARLADGPAAVIAVGAGAPTHAASRAVLEAGARVLWLDATPAVLAARLADATDRPLLRGDAGTDRLVERLAAQRAAREPIYRAIATGRILTDALDLDAVVAAAAGWARSPR